MLRHYVQKSVVNLMNRALQFIHLLGCCTHWLWKAIHSSRWAQSRLRVLFHLLLLNWSVKCRTKSLPFLRISWNFIGLKATSRERYLISLSSKARYWRVLFVIRLGRLALTLVTMSLHLIGCAWCKKRRVRRGGMLTAWIMALQSRRGHLKRQVYMFLVILNLVGKVLRLERCALRLFKILIYLIIWVHGFQRYSRALSFVLNHPPFSLCLTWRVLSKALLFLRNRISRVQIAWEILAWLNIEKAVTVDWLILRLIVYEWILGRWAVHWADISLTVLVKSSGTFIWREIK